MLPPVLVEHNLPLLLFFGKVGRITARAVLGSNLHQGAREHLLEAPPLGDTSGEGVFHDNHRLFRYDHPYMRTRKVSAVQHPEALALAVWEREPAVAEGILTADVER